MSSCIKNTIRNHIDIVMLIWRIVFWYLLSGIMLLLFLMIHPIEEYPVDNPLDTIIFFGAILASSPELLNTTAPNSSMAAINSLSFIWGAAIVSLEFTLLIGGLVGLKVRGRYTDYLSIRLSIFAITWGICSVLLPIIGFLLEAAMINPSRAIAIFIPEFLPLSFIYGLSFVAIIIIFAAYFPLIVFNIGSSDIHSFLAGDLFTIGFLAVIGLYLEYYVLQVYSHAIHNLRVYVKAKEKREGLDLLEPIAPDLTEKYLKKAVKDYRVYVRQAKDMDDSVAKLLLYLRENNQFPSTRDLFEMGVRLETIELATMLLNAVYEVSLKDFKKINWEHFNDRSKEIVTSLGNDPRKYTMEAIVLDAKVNFITAKIFLSVFPYLEQEETVEKIPDIIPQDKLDEIACSILRLNHKQGWKTANALQIAFSLKIGLLSVVKGLQYIAIKTRKLPDTSKLPVNTKITIENYARELSIKERNQEILSSNDPGEVAEVLNINSLLLTLQTIAMFSREIVGRNGTIEAISTAKTEGLKIQEKVILAAASDKRLDDEIDKLMKQFEEMEKRKTGKI